MSEDDEDLSALMDGAMRTMLKEVARPDSDMDVVDKVKVLAEATKWMAAKGKMPAPKQESKFAHSVLRRLEPRSRASGGGRAGGGEEGQA